MDSILDVLDSYYGHPKVDYRGERWTLCPFHGDRHVGSFSYGERGYCCLSCGAQGGLGALADQLGIHSNAPIVMLAPARPRPVILHEWQKVPDYWRRYLTLPKSARAYYHKRGFTDATIAERRLGFGTLPASRCPYSRAILPVFDGDRLVALRGRRLFQADTDDKWLCAGGSRTVLYGADTLAPNRVVVITEAPYSAILAHQHRPDVAAVAICGAALWKDEWSRQIAESLPALCIVWLDNDMAGQPNAETYAAGLARWEREHPGKLCPEPNGPKVAAALTKYGVPTRLYQWPEGTAESRDLADELVAGFEMPIPAVRPRPLALAGVSHDLW